MLIAEDLLLLLHENIGGSARERARVELALAGAVLLELAERGNVGFTEQREDVEAGRVLIVDGSATGHQILDASLARLAEVEGSLPKDAIPAMADGLCEELLADLLQRGVLERDAGTDEESPALLSEPAEGHIAGLRASLREILRSGAGQDDRQLQLLALLSGADLEAAVLDPADDTTDEDELDRRELLVTEGAWIRDELAKALQRDDVPSGGSGIGPFG